MHHFRSWSSALAVVLILFLTGCQNATSSTPSTTSAYKTYLYITDTANGHVGAWDPSTHKMVKSSWVTTAGSAGEIRFYKGIGYVAVGSGTGAGVYRFDPAATSPTASLVAGTSSLNAQYFAFVSASEAYFSTANYPGSGSVYRFNPSDPSSSATLVSTPGGYLQEIVLGVDGKLYVAVNDAGTVKRIDPTTKSVTATFTTSSSGTTGLFAGTYNSVAGIYVANTGGSLDFIPYTATDGVSPSTVLTTSAATPFYPARVIQLSSSKLVASGYDTSYANHTYLVSLEGSSATVSEVKSSGSSFGSLSLVYKSGMIYVPSSTYGVTGSSKLYAFDTAGTAADFSPASVLVSTDAASNAAFYEE